MQSWTQKEYPLDTVARRTAANYTNQLLSNRQRTAVKSWGYGDGLKVATSRYGEVHCDLSRAAIIAHKKAINAETWTVKVTPTIGVATVENHVLEVSFDKEQGRWYCQPSAE